ncbi:hypothetical protein [Streptomyces sp. NPDC058084]|uniref:hypothetical protein n=1 Tax=Streptomyces sp. NPDC058084 TaxID=3346333 RepID=UPI0036ECD9E1
MSSACTCPYCDPKAPEPLAEPAARQPVELPSEPRKFRVHSTDGGTQDYTLHPDGRMTTVMAGQLWVSCLSLDDMLEMNWADDRIEWDPQGEPEPPESPAPEPSPTYEAVQGW